MTDTFQPATKPALGVGAIIAESFSILFRKIGAVVGLSFVPTVIGLIISGVLIGFSATLGVGDPTDPIPGGPVPFILAMVVQFAIFGIITALLVQMAYDVKLDRMPRLTAYLGPTLRVIVPIVVLTLISTLAFAFGLVLLVVAGLWVGAVFYVTVPAIVIEGAGFGGLGRSARLTREYRWPIVGLLVLIGICIIVMSLAVNFVLGTLIASFGSSSIIVIGILMQAISAAFTYGLGSIAIALTYARLREIKEGVGVQDIVAVFD